MKTAASLTLVWLIGVGMGIPLGARYEYDVPLTEPTKSQAKTELAVCMATMVRAGEVLDSVDAWIREQRAQPVGYSVAWNEVGR